MNDVHRYAALAVGLLASLAAVPGAASAAHRRRGPAPLVVHAGAPAAPLDVAVAPGVAFRTPFAVVAGVPARIVRVPHYIGPDGTYDEYADLVRSINGTPCGEDCTRRSLLRWGFVPVD